MTSYMILCEIEQHGVILINYLNNSMRGKFIILSQEETIPDLETLDLVALEGRFLLSSTI